MIRLEADLRLGPRLLWALCAMIVTAALYVPSRSFEFSGVDDEQHLQSNPAVAHPGQVPLTAIWRQPYFNMYIPVTYTVWRYVNVFGNPVIFGEQHVSALSPQMRAAPFHTANIFSHAVNVLLVYVLLILGFRQSSPALIGALVFACHPLQVEAVAWISSFKDLLSTVLGLCGMLVQLFIARQDAMVNAANEANPRVRGRRLLAVMPFFLLYLAATLAKPSAVVMPLMALVMELLWYPRPQPGRIWRLGCALGVVFVGFGIANAAQPLVTMPFKLELWQRPLVALRAIAFYIEKLLLPVGLVADYSMTPDWIVAQPSSYAWMVVTLVLTWFVLGTSVAKVHKSAFIIWMIGLLPTLGLWPYYYQAISTVADRYAYAAMLGVALAVGGIWQTAKSLVLKFAVVVALFLCAFLTWRQEATWQNGWTVFQHVLELNPRSWFAHGNLGANLARSGELAGAKAHLREAIAIRPWFPDAHVNLGVIAEAEGQWQQAVRHYQDALEYEPAAPDTYRRIGEVYGTVGNWREAEAAFRQALALNGRHVSSLLGLARILVQRKSLLEARGVLKTVVSLAPWNGNALALLGQVLLQLNLVGEALPTLQEAVAQGALGPEVWFNLGLARLSLGDPRSATRALQQGLQIQPESAIGYFNLGLAAEAMGDNVAAAQEFEQAMRIDPAFMPARAAHQRVKNKIGP